MPFATANSHSNAPADKDPQPSEANDDAVPAQSDQNGEETHPGQAGDAARDPNGPPDDDR